MKSLDVHPAIWLLYTVVHEGERLSKNGLKFPRVTADDVEAKAARPKRIARSDEGDMMNCGVKFWDVPLN